jgi:hypothetical protein
MEQAVRVGTTAWSIVFAAVVAQGKTFNESQDTLQQERKVTDLNSFQNLCYLESRTWHQTYET